MTEHAPLTPSQRELCNKIAAAPMRMTSGEMTSADSVGKDAAFLMNAGYLNGAVVYVAQESRDSVIELVRSGKALPV